jgi:hypothetical protein
MDGFQKELQHLFTAYIVDKAHLAFVGVRISMQVDELNLT